MSLGIDVLFFAFANDAANPLPALKKESEALQKTLTPFALQQHFLLHFDPFASLDKIAEYIILFKEDLTVFHYGGHAGPDGLYLDNEQAKALGIARLLGQCPRLKLVVLNGCSSKGQVELLQKQGIPAIIGTHGQIGDENAYKFATRFYEASVLQNSIKDAFELAIGQIQAIDDQLIIERGLALRSELEDNKALWGCFGTLEALDWKFPAATVTLHQTEFVPNKYLLENLTLAFSNYNDEVLRLKELEDQYIEVSVLDKREAILKSLPHPISEQVRKLLVPESTNINAVFFDKLGPDRLKQMIAVFNTLIDLILFILLSQIWNALIKETEFILTEQEREQIRRFFLHQSSSTKQYESFSVLYTIQHIFERNKLDHFVEELDHAEGIFDQGQTFQMACNFLDSVAKQLASSNLNQQEASLLCISSEEKIAVVLGTLGFLTRYTIASVKGIDVIKYRHLPYPKFKHKVVRLVQRFVGLAEEQQILDDFTDNISVLLIKDTAHGTQFLNLTPFVIDENAFNEKANIAKLHFFEKYVPEQDAYVYRHIYKPLDIPLVVSEQKNFAVLKAQFDAFAQLLFDHPMKQVV